MKVSTIHTGGGAVLTLEDGRQIRVFAHIESPSRLRLAIEAEKGIKIEHQDGPRRGLSPRRRK